MIFNLECCQRENATVNLKSLSLQDDLFDVHFMYLILMPPHGHGTLIS